MIVDRLYFSRVQKLGWKHLQYQFDDYAHRYPSNINYYFIWKLCPPARMAQRAPPLPPALNYGRACKPIGAGRSSCVISSNDSHQVQRGMYSSIVTCASLGKEWNIPHPSGAAGIDWMSTFRSNVCHLAYYSMLAFMLGFKKTTPIPSIVKSRIVRIIVTNWCPLWCHWRRGFCWSMLRDLGTKSPASESLNECMGNPLSF